MRLDEPMTKRLASTCAVLLLLGVGCASDDTVNGRQIAESGGWEWPLTVEQVRILCPGDRQLVVLADGVKYAINGTAKSAGYAALDPIWRDDPNTPGLKVPMDGLTKHAAAVCYGG